MFNPDKILYGRLPGYQLSDLGHQMARLAADALADHDIVHLVSSPLERAQQTAAPLVEQTGLELILDPRVIEGDNRFEGMAVAGGRGCSSSRTCRWRATRSGRAGRALRRDPGPDDPGGPRCT